MPKIDPYAALIAAVMTTGTVMVASIVYAAVGKPVFSDGFETGDASKWSSIITPQPPTVADIHEYPFAVSISDVGGGNVALLFTAASVNGRPFTWVMNDGSSQSAMVGQVVTVRWPCQVGSSCSFAPSLVRAKFTVKR